MPTEYRIGMSEARRPHLSGLAHASPSLFPALHAGLLLLLATVPAFRPRDMLPVRVPPVARVYHSSQGRQTG